MQSKIDPLPHQFEDNFNDIKSDSGSITVFSGGTVSPGSPAVLQRQWITLTAEMWPPSSSSSEESAGSSTQPFAPRISRLPLLAGVFCGAALVVAILGACLLYWCCIMPRKDNNNKLCSRKNDPNTISSSNTTSIQIQTTTVPGRLISSTNPSSSSSSSAYPISQSAVFAEQKRCGWGYTNRLIAGGGPLQPNPWYTSRVIGGPQCTQCPGICPVPRSNSSPSNSHHYCNNGDIPASSSSRRERPVSQPIIPSSNIVNINGETGISALPEISEFCPNSSQYASSSILDEIINDPNNTSRRNQNSSEEPTLKTRSLPAWVRSKPRPLSTEDDLNNLYAKVNFSKKRKNRMRNDEAAIIALSKSRSQFLHKDTDSLVDNEAVIVYDERTAL